MKKLYLLSTMAVFAVVSMDASEVRKTPGNIKEHRRYDIERVQWQKIERQRQLARPSIYTMVDALIKEEPMSQTFDQNGEMIAETPAKVTVDWPAVFRILDKMKGVIDVNEYSTYLQGDPLLWVAVEQGNFSAAKTLLEKYKANPNVPGCVIVHKEGEVCERKSLLRFAQHKKDFTMALLLRQHGANL